MDSCCGLGRTGLTGRRDRSDRYNDRLREIGLTGIAVAEKVKLGFVGEFSWKLVGLLVDCNFYKSCMHFSCHMHMHTCSSCGGGGRIQGGCGATGAQGQAP